MGLSVPLHMPGLVLQGLAPLHEQACLALEPVTGAGTGAGASLYMDRQEQWS